MSKATALVHAGQRAGSMLRESLAKHPTAVSRIGELLKRPGATVEQIMAAAKASPMTAALVVMELGDMGKEVANMISDVDPDVASALTSMGFVPDEPPVDGVVNLQDLSKYADEMQAITTCAREVGGIAQLIRLRSVLRMDDRFFDMYFQMREFSRSF